MARHANRRDPRAHWFLLALGMLVLLGELCLAGYVNHVGAEGGDPRPAAAERKPAPADVTSAGPVLHVDGDRRVSSRGMPANTIALTFDDGPDPQWTPAILDILGPARRARDVLRHRLEGQRAPGADAPDSRRGSRARRTHLYPRGAGGRAAVATRPRTDLVPKRDRRGYWLPERIDATAVLLRDQRASAPTSSTPWPMSPRTSTSSC